jgi:membrane protease subunit (stomatin/prohibitin family)
MKITLTRSQAGRIAGAEREAGMLDQQAQAHEQQAQQSQARAAALKKAAVEAERAAFEDVCSDHGVKVPPPGTRYLLKDEDGVSVLEWADPKPFGNLVRREAKKPAPRPVHDECRDPDCPDAVLAPTQTTKPEDAAQPAVTG